MHCAPGHPDVRTTQIYAKIVDSKKIEAVGMPCLRTKNYFCLVFLCQKGSFSCKNDSGYSNYIIFAAKIIIYGK